MEKTHLKVAQAARLVSPCPHCGGSAGLRYYTHDTRRCYYACDDSRCHHVYLDPNKALAAWNQRANDSSSAPGRNAAFGSEILEAAKVRVAECGGGEEDEEIMQAAYRHGLIARVVYDPEKHGDVNSDCEPGGAIWWWGSGWEAPNDEAHRPDRGPLANRKLVWLLQGGGTLVSDNGEEAVVLKNGSYCVIDVWGKVMWQEEAPSICD